VQTRGRTQVERGEFGGSFWELASREPCAPLRPYVRRLAGYDERSPQPQSQRQLPEPFVVLIFEFGAPLRVTLGSGAREATRHPGGFVAGLGDAFAITEHEGSQRGVQVDLTPTGARRFLDLPLSEIAGRIVALRDLQPAEHRTLDERLDALPDWVARLDLVEALLARRILGSRVDTTRVDRAVGRIEAAGGALEVGSLAHELGISPKHLITLFHDQVGAPPKLLARLVRFQRLMRSTRCGVEVPWAELAMTHGYYDQAHLARDVKRFTGLTPTEVRRSLPEVLDLLG
jgi:AraC-like DNA-binding protein